MLEHGRLPQGLGHADGRAVVMGCDEPLARGGSGEGWRGLVEALAGFGIDIETAMPDAEEDFVRMLDDCPTGTVNLRSCGRPANHISLIGHT